MFLFVVLEFYPINRPTHLSTILASKCFQNFVAALSWMPAFYASVPLATLISEIDKGVRCSWAFSVWPTLALREVFCPQASASAFLSHSFCFHQANFFFSWKGSRHLISPSIRCFHSCNGRRKEQGSADLSLYGVRYSKTRGEGIT